MKCEECGSGFGYVRLNKQQWICRNCGKTSEIKTAKKIIKNFTGLNKIQ